MIIIQSGNEQTNMRKHSVHLRGGTERKFKKKETIFIDKYLSSSETNMNCMTFSIWTGKSAITSMPTIKHIKQINEINYSFGNGKSFRKNDGK